eukprot:361002-Chlamydomonas_euryale.AAC.4
MGGVKGVRVEGGARGVSKGVACVWGEGEGASAACASAGGRPIADVPVRGVCGGESRHMRAACMSGREQTHARGMHGRERADKCARHAWTGESRHMRAANQSHEGVEGQSSSSSVAAAGGLCILTG